MNTTIGQIMTTNLHTITESDDIQLVNKMFTKNKIRHVPVLRDGHLVGILSLTDLQRLSFQDIYDDLDNDLSIMNMLKVGQIMHSKPVTVSSKDKVTDVARILTEVEFHAMPVVDSDKLVGIVTTTDIIRYLLSVIN